MRGNHYKKEPPGECTKCWCACPSVRVSGCANVCTIVCVCVCVGFAIVFALLKNIPPPWHLLLSSSNKEVLDLMHKQWLITLFIFSPSPPILPSPCHCLFSFRLWGRGEDETSQPSSDPAVRHTVQGCKGGLQKRLRYVTDLLYVWSLFIKMVL